MTCVLAQRGTRTNDTDLIWSWKKKKGECVIWHEAVVFFFSGLAYISPQQTGFGFGGDVCFL